MSWDTQYVKSDIKYYCFFFFCQDIACQSLAFS